MTIKTIYYLLDWIPSAGADTQGAEFFCTNWESAITRAEQVTRWLIEDTIKEDIATRIVFAHFLRVSWFNVWQPQIIQHNQLQLIPHVDAAFRQLFLALPGDTCERSRKVTESMWNGDLGYWFDFSYFEGALLVGAHDIRDDRV